MTQYFYWGVSILALRPYTQALIDNGIAHCTLVSLVLGVMLQVSLQWPAMIIAGAIGSVFVKRHRHAFIGGFWGVALAWCVFLFIQVNFFNGYEVAEIFASEIGAAGFGRIFTSLSLLLGGILGGTGALVGFSVVDLIQEYRSKSTSDECVISHQGR